MQHVPLGRSGLLVSRLCLGTMTFGLQTTEEASRAILDKAAEHGIDFIDTADAYPLGGDTATAGRTEEIVGRWLKGRREDFIVASKCVARIGPRPWDIGAMVARGVRIGSHNPLAPEASNSGFATRSGVCCTASFPKDIRIELLGVYKPTPGDHQQRTCADERNLVLSHEPSQ